jgi:putative hemolysin
VASEMALVSLREGQVRVLAERGGRGRRVQQLVEDPNRFLSAVQLGVTLTAILSSAFGAVTLSRNLADGLRSSGLSGPWPGVLGFVIVTLAITYIQLVLGELAPKRLALQRAEGTAQMVSPFIDWVARLSRPFIWLLSQSTNVIVRVLGGDPSVGREAITEEELRDLVTAHESLSRDERQLIDEVFAAGDRQIREVIVPRTEVEFLDAGMTVSRAAKNAAATPYSRFPVVRGSHDEVVGFVHVKDLLSPPVSSRRSMKVGDLAREVALLPATKRILPALSQMRADGQHLAVVVDEYGGTAGIVTLEDLIEELIGDIRDEYDVEVAEPRRLRSGDIELDGLCNRDDFADETSLELPEGPFETVAGYVMATLGRVPRSGDVVELPGGRLKVREMDGRRVARVLLTPLASEEEAEAAADAREPADAGTMRV